MADAVVDEALDAGRGDGQGEVVVETLDLDELGVALGRSRGLGGGLLRLDLLPVDLGKLGLETVVVAEDLQGVASDVNKAVVVFLLSVLVNDTAGKDRGHFGAIDGLRLVPVAGHGGVAAVFREEDGDRGVAEVLGQDIVGRALVGGIWAAPAVRVDGEDIGTAHVIGIAVLGALHVVPGVPKDLADVSGRVANGNLALDVLLDVVLQVTGDGTKIGGDEFGGRNVIDDFVSGEEEQGIWVVAEGLGDGKGAVRIGFIVAGPGLERGDSLADQRRVDI